MLAATAETSTHAERPPPPRPSAPRTRPSETRRHHNTDGNAPRSGEGEARRPSPVPTHAPPSAPDAAQGPDDGSRRTTGGVHSRWGGHGEGGVRAPHTPTPPGACCHRQGGQSRRAHSHAATPSPPTRAPGAGPGAQRDPPPTQRGEARATVRQESGRTIPTAGTGGPLLPPQQGLGKEGSSRPDTHRPTATTRDHRQRLSRGRTRQTRAATAAGHTLLLGSLEKYLLTEGGPHPAPPATPVGARRETVEEATRLGGVCGTGRGSGKAASGAYAAGAGRGARHPPPGGAPPTSGVRPDGTAERPKPSPQREEKQLKNRRRVVSLTPPPSAGPAQPRSLTHPRAPPGG